MYQVMRQKQDLTWVTEAVYKDFSAAKRHKYIYNYVSPKTIIIIRQTNGGN